MIHARLQKMRSSFSHSLYDLLICHLKRGGGGGRESLKNFRGKNRKTQLNEKNFVFLAHAIRRRRL
jgi:hypothetical protein